MLLKQQQYSTFSNMVANFWLWYDYLFVLVILKSSVFHGLTDHSCFVSCSALVALLTHESTENALWINGVAESATFRKVNKNNIHVNDTDSILRYLIYLSTQHSVQCKLKPQIYCNTFSSLCQKFRKWARMVSLHHQAHKQCTKN